jgi:hypothetical protein
VNDRNLSADITTFSGFGKPFLETMHFLTYIGISILLSIHEELIPEVMTSALEKLAYHNPIEKLNIAAIRNLGNRSSIPYWCCCTA